MNFRIRKSVRLLWLVLIAVLALGLSACGGGGDEADVAETGGGSESGGGSGSGTVPDPCSLLTTADVEAILGGSSNANGSVTEDGLFGSCTWLAPERGATLSLNIWASGSADDGWAEQFVSSQAAASETEEVSSPGVKAFLAEDDDSWGLYWNKENQYVVVLAIRGNTSASRDSVISLGEKIDGGF